MKLKTTQGRYKLLLPSLLLSDVTSDAGLAVEMMDDDAGPAVEMMDDDVATSPIASTICNSSTSGSGLDEFQDEIRDGSEEIEDANDIVPSGYAARKRAKVGCHQIIFMSPLVIWIHRKRGVHR